MRTIAHFVFAFLSLTLACQSRETPTHLPASATEAVERFHAASPFSDSRLSVALQSAIVADPILGAQPVSANAVDGAVTLSGKVATLSAKLRATQLAGTFKGVTAVHNALTLRAPPQPSEQIVKDVTDAIARDPAMRGSIVKATATSGAITLSGSVKSSAQRGLLSDIAARIPGVQKVETNVDLALGSPRTDAQIESTIREELSDDARLDGTQVTVRVHNGAATITGVLASLSQRDAAAEDAWTAGTLHVDIDAVRVDWLNGERTRAINARSLPTDAHIADTIRQAFTEDQRLDEPLPKVAVDGGLVTLTGRVVDFRASRAAVSDATRVRGVWRVIDRTSVSAAKRESDELIQAQAQATVYNDPLAARDAHGIAISTSHGRVTLQGAVAAPEEKTMIEDDVEEIPGVVAVDDKLKALGYVAQTHAVPEQSIQNRVVERIFWDPRVGSDRVRVDVTPSGDVTLSGVLDSWDETRAAAADAVLAGAAHVTNQLGASETAAPTVAR